MTGKIKTFTGLIIFILFIAAAIFAYNMLKNTVKPKTSIDLAAEKTAENIESLSGTPEEAVKSDRQKAVDFTVSDKDGNELKLTEIAAGKPVVINFWASWCPPCKDELPYFEKANTELSGEIVFMMVNLTDGQRETREIAERFVKDSGYTFPVYYDIKGEGSANYVQRYIPVTVFIDKDGNIVTGYEGGIDEGTLQKGISLIK